MSLFGDNTEQYLNAADNSDGSVGGLAKGVLTSVVPGAGAVWNFVSSLGSPDDSQHWEAKDWPWYIDMDPAHHPAPNFLVFLDKNRDFFNIPWDTAPNSGIRLTVQEKVQRTVKRMTVEGYGSQINLAIQSLYPYGFDSAGNPASKPTIVSALGINNGTTKAGIFGNIWITILFIGVLVGGLFAWLKPKKKGYRFKMTTILLASSLIASSQVSNNGIKQLPADWNATSGVQRILNKPLFMQKADSLSGGYSTWKNTRRLIDSLAAHGNQTTYNLIAPRFDINNALNARSRLASNLLTSNRGVEFPDEDGVVILDVDTSVMLQNYARAVYFIQKAGDYGMSGSFDYFGTVGEEVLRLTDTSGSSQSIYRSDGVTISCDIVHPGLVIQYYGDNDRNLTFTPLGISVNNLFGYSASVSSTSIDVSDTVRTSRTLAMHPDGLLSTDSSYRYTFLSFKHKTFGFTDTVYVPDLNGVNDTIALKRDLPLSGQYTPSFSSTSNITSTATNGATYMRVGNAVTVSGYLSLVTTLGGSTSGVISLPIFSHLSATKDGNGVGSVSTNGPALSSVSFYTVGGALNFNFYSTVAATSVGMTYQFTYYID